MTVHTIRDTALPSEDSVRTRNTKRRMTVLAEREVNRDQLEALNDADTKGISLVAASQVLGTLLGSTKAVH